MPLLWLGLYKSPVEMTSPEVEHWLATHTRSGTDTIHRSVESLLADASQALSGLSRGAGVVLAGKMDIRLKHVEFIRIEPTRGLVVLVGEDGSVENRLIDLDPGTTPSALVEAGTISIPTSAAGRSPRRGRRWSGARARRAPNSTG